MMTFVITAFSLLCIALFVVVAINLSVYIKAMSNGIALSFVQIVLCRCRGLNPNHLLECYITLVKSGLELAFSDLESHALVGGDVLSVTEATVSAYKANLDIGYQEICRIDLAGRDVVQAINDYVNPVIIHCPVKTSKDRGSIVAVARDGIRIGVSVKLTVRSNIKQLIGTAGKDTVSARVQERILSCVGMAESHKEILNSPKEIGEVVKSTGDLLDGTYYSLVSVDVSEVVLLDNLKAKLDSEQSEADKKVAEAKAEAKRAEAKAKQQEMKAKLQEMHSSVVLARETLPNAMSEAIDFGNVGSPKSCVKNVDQWRSQGL